MAELKLQEREPQFDYHHFALATTPVLTKHALFLMAGIPHNGKFSAAEKEHEAPSEFLCC